MKDDSIIVKNKHFKGANCVIRICKNIENKFIAQELLNKNEFLYMNVVNSEVEKSIINFKLDDILPISRVHITAYIEKI